VEILIKFGKYAIIITILSDKTEHCRIINTYKTVKKGRKNG